MNQKEKEKTTRTVVKECSVCTFSVGLWAKNLASYLFMLFKLLLFSSS